MSKPKKWLRVTSIDQIKVGSDVRMADRVGEPLTFTVKVASRDRRTVKSTADHLWLFDWEGRKWYVRNPEWVKPPNRDKEMVKLLKGEVNALAHELERLRDAQQDLKAASLHEGHSAWHWHNRFRTQVAHSEGVQAALTRRNAEIEELKAKIAELEAEPTPIDPDTIKAGDRVRVHDDPGGSVLRECTFTVNGVTGGLINGFLKKHPGRTWFMVTPAPKLVMPEEPDPWTFFRLDRTGVEWIRHRQRYVRVDDTKYYCWEEFVRHGDAITILELRPVGEDK